MAQKYTKARQEANARYDSKTYKLVAIRLRIVDDKDIIDELTAVQENGISYREWLRDLYDRKVKEEGK